MRKLLIFLALFLLSTVSIAQTDITKDSIQPISSSKVAKYPGGIQALQRYIAEHFRYPEEALENDVAGTVFLSFVVDTFGLITDLQTDTIHYTTVALKSKSKKKQEKRKLFMEKLIQEDNDYGLRQAAKDALKGSSKWAPAEQDGVKVKMRYRLPVKFHIF